MNSLRCFRSVVLIFLLLMLTNIEARQTYPGYTVFDDKKGTFMKVTGPILGRSKISFSRMPPYKLTDVISYYFEFIPSETLNTIYVKGESSYDGFPVWSEDGALNHCFDKVLVCPLKAGVKYSFNSTLNVGNLVPLAGKYTASVEVFTVTAHNQKIRVIGAEGAYVHS